MSTSPQLLKIIACEVALREICFAASRSRNLVDLEFLPQGLHDTPATGVVEIQKRIDAVPAGKYAAVLIGYGLCGNILRGIRARATPLVIPRAHDCITFFLGSKERYQQFADSDPGSYYYTSGWLECLQRRGAAAPASGLQFLPTRAGVGGSATTMFEQFVQKYGEEKARYLMEVMDEWTSHYTRGVLIDFEFTKLLGLRERVERICADRGWQFTELPGDLGLLQRWVDGEWSAAEFLTVPPAQVVSPSYREDIVEARPAV